MAGIATTFTFQHLGQTDLIFCLSQLPDPATLTSYAFRVASGNLSTQIKGTNAPKDKLGGNASAQAALQPLDPRVPTVPASLQMVPGPTRGQDARFPTLGSAGPWNVTSTARSLKAPHPRPPRGCPSAPPARGLRVPGTRRLPAGGATSRASLRTSRDTSAVLPEPQALTRTGRRLRERRTPPPERRGAPRCGIGARPQAPPARPPLPGWDVPRLPPRGRRAREVELTSESRAQCHQRNRSRSSSLSQTRPHHQTPVVPLSC